MTNQIETIRQWLGSGSINFFGLPFAGKDSQARRIQAKLGGKILSSGEIFRNSVIPDDTMAIMERGELMPSDTFTEIILPYLSRPEFAGHPFLLSSVGRWKGEEIGVIEALKDSNHETKAVIYLNLDENIVFERSKLDENEAVRGVRADDGEGKLQKRVDEFEQKTIPVLDTYRKLGLLIEIDASLPKNEVEQKILEALAERANRA
jgi:adenylate kinase